MTAHETHIELLALELGSFRTEAERRFDKLDTDIAMLKSDVTRLKHDMIDIKSSLKIIIDALAV